MASTQFDLPSLEGSWFRSARPVPPSGQLTDLLPVRPVSPARARRQRQVKILGCALIAGLGACAVAMMATSPAASEVIESWGTMGKTAQARLTPTAGDLGATSEPELTLGAGTIAWAEDPPPAESSRAMGSTDEPSAAAAVPAVWQASAHASDDPYVDVRSAPAAPRQSPFSGEPY